MATFVINEWLPEDSSGRNGRKAQREALTVITKLADSDHQVVIVEQSPFEAKFFGLCKNNRDIAVRGIARAYMMNLRTDLNRCIVLKPEDTVPIPEALAAATKADDHYLLQALLTIAGAILVTTDGTLHEAVQAAGQSCLFREEFVSTFF